jgi:putative DNA primase/helicase
MASNPRVRPRGNGKSSLSLVEQAGVVMGVAETGVQAPDSTLKILSPPMIDLANVAVTDGMDGVERGLSSFSELRPVFEVAQPSIPPNPTDTGNALRFASQHRGKVRYCGQYGKWLAWDGRRWKEDTTGQVYRLARKTIQRMWREAIDIDDGKAKDWCMESESRKHIDAMIYLARYMEGIPVEASELDRDPWLLNVRNGTIDLQTGKLRPHDPEELLTKICDVSYDPEALCPRFVRFLDEIMDGRSDMVDYLLRCLGYCITGDVREHVLFFFYGEGRNGKSLLLAIVQGILQDYATVVNASLITSKQQEDHPTGLTDLEGRRFVSTIEVADGKRMAEALVKQLTGGDRIKARRMRQDFYEFDPVHKLILAANHRPEIKGTDEAIWERIKVIPFDVTFVEESRFDPSKKLLLKDKQLAGALESERQGILALLVRSCLAWQAQGLKEPESVVRATKEYRSDMNDIETFIDQICFCSPAVRVKATELREAYLAWAKLNGYEAMKGRAFGSEMERRGYTLKKSNSIAWRDGIGIKAEHKEEKTANAT